MTQHAFLTTRHAKRLHPQSDRVVVSRTNGYGKAIICLRITGWPARAVPPTAGAAATTLLLATARSQPAMPRRLRPTLHPCTASRSPRRRPVARAPRTSQQALQEERGDSKMVRESRCMCMEAEISASRPAYCAELTASQGIYNSRLLQVLAKLLLLDVRGLRRMDQWQAL